MDVQLDGSREGYAGRIEVMPGVVKRRRWPDALKALIAAESLAPGVRVADAARRHGCTRGQVYDWRRLARNGLLALPAAAEAPGFAALAVEETPPAGKDSAPRKGAVIEIVVAELVIRAPEGVAEAALATAIRAARAAR